MPDTAVALVEQLLVLSAQELAGAKRPTASRNPNGIVSCTSRRVTRYRDAETALRWTATGFIEAENAFRKIQGIKDSGYSRLHWAGSRRAKRLTRGEKPHSVT